MLVINVAYTVVFVTVPTQVREAGAAGKQRDYVSTVERAGDFRELPLTEEDKNNLEMIRNE